MRRSKVFFAVWIGMIGVLGCAKEDTGTASLFFEGGANALREGQNADAIRKFERAIQIDPNYAEAYYGLGLALKNTGAFDKAIIEMEKSLQAGTEYTRGHFEPRAHFQLGTLYRLKNLDKKAIQHWKTAVTLRPRYIEAHSNLAITYQKLGRYDEAIEEWKTLIDIPGYTTPHIARSNLSAAYRASNRLEDALIQAQIAVELTKQLEIEYAGAYKNLGLVYADMGRYDLAIDAYRETLRILPSHIEIYYYLGVAYEAVGNQAEALKAYRTYRENAMTSERDEEVQAAIQRIIRVD